MTDLRVSSDGVSPMQLGVRVGYEGWQHGGILFPSRRGVAPHHPPGFQ